MLESTTYYSSFKDFTYVCTGFETKSHVLQVFCYSIHFVQMINCLIAWSLVYNSSTSNPIQKKKVQSGVDFESQPPNPLLHNSARHGSQIFPTSRATRDDHQIEPAQWLLRRRQRRWLHPPPRLPRRRPGGRRRRRGPGYREGFGGRCSAGGARSRGLRAAAAEPVQGGGRRARPHAPPGAVLPPRRPEPHRPLRPRRGPAAFAFFTSVKSDTRMRLLRIPCFDLLTCAGLFVAWVTICTRLCFLSSDYFLGNEWSILVYLYLRILRIRLRSWPEDCFMMSELTRECIVVNTIVVAIFGGLNYQQKCYQSRVTGREARLEPMLIYLG